MILGPSPGHLRIAMTTKHLKALLDDHNVFEVRLIRNINKKEQKKI